MHKQVTTLDAPPAVLEDISGDYTIDPAHTRLGFAARHAMVTRVRGAFTECSGTAHVDTADLTIKGITRPVTVLFDYTGSAKDPYGNVRIGFEGKASINRRDWGLTWNAALETGGVMVSDKVTLEFDVSAIRDA